MAVEANTLASLFDKLKVDDPCVPPKPWESIPSESGCFSSQSKSQTSHSLYHISTLSESNLVRLAMNAMQGVESALITIDKLSGLLCSDSADRTFHLISNLWTWSSSTLALGNLLKSIGQFGSIIFLLHKFVAYFMHLNPDGNSGFEENLRADNGESKELPNCNLSLVNQAFAVAVEKALVGYVSALNTLYSSVSIRRTLKNGDGGCLMDIGNAEITLLEVYLHTKGLRIQMEALGNICHMSDLALGFSVLPFEGLIDKANKVFLNFPRGGNLLTFLYMQLKVVDSVHCALLKFLFLQSCEPYFGFIISWIYEGRISDPYNEFVVEYVKNLPAQTLGNSGIPTDFPLNTVRVRDGVTLPYFLEELMIPLLRAGQQLQVVVRLLELCNSLGTCNATYEQILPFLEDIPSEYPFFAYGLTFQKGTIENMALARKSYYERLQGKVENILAKFEFRSRWESPHNIQLLYAVNHGRNLNHYNSLVDDIFIPLVIDGRDENRAITISDDEVSEDKSLSTEDLLESSESASLDTIEEQNESGKVCNNTTGLEPSYFSSLSFSFSSYSDQLAQKPPVSLSTESFSSEICERRKDACQAIGYHHDRTDVNYGSLTYQIGEQNLSWLDDTECSDDQDEKGLLFGCILDYHSYMSGGNDRVAWLDLTGTQLKVNRKILEFWKANISSSSDTICSGNISIDRPGDKNEHLDGISSFPNACYECSWDSRYNSKYLSSNPILSKSYLFNYSNKAGESNSMNYGEALPYFDFTSVKDPRTVCKEKLDFHPRQQIGAEFSILADMAAADAAKVSASHSNEGCSYVNSKKKTTPAGSHIRSNSEADNWEDNLHGTGGSGWETLLACFHKTPGLAADGYRDISAEVFEMPLDYVIKKCLLEQILLQYKYVSKLTIKLLEEGFDLQEHLLALRRYHFMDLADWADLFILSLWHHKWYMVDADKRIPEIQGVLESSVQSSSCEGDPNKDRLYIYMKRDYVMPISTSVNGVHSFDFLGLGYRVDWPVSIILTPGALKIYSNIFNFLIQVKLAVFSLSDTWCLLKDLMQSTKLNRRSELPKQALHHICLLTETRHHINHFVSTLQQYVQSQLSHVSWCKFLNSLKHKVKDMMDLEVVHMAYLAESLQICFLSDETRAIASIIQSILQIAMDFRSGLIGHSMKVGPRGEDSVSDLSEIDIAEVIAIKTTFMKNLKDLYLCYLKSPKHAEYGLSHFWDYLNSNDYYTEILDKQHGSLIY